MIRRYSPAEVNALQREHWLKTRANGKSRFIWRQAAGNTVTTLLVLVVVEFLADRPVVWQTVWFSLVIMLPILMLGAYLTAKWTWQDFEKKYGDDRLPPWE
jgi:bacteriorhodopsin